MRHVQRLLQQQGCLPLLRGSRAYLRTVVNHNDALQRLGGWMSGRGTVWQPFMVDPW